LRGGRIPQPRLNSFSAMEKRRSRYQTHRWQLARERIGELVRENYRVNQEMSPRLAALIKKIENGNTELSTEVFRARGEKQDD
jgi:hypothetical protein